VLRALSILIVKSRIEAPVLLCVSVSPCLRGKKPYFEFTSWIPRTDKPLRESKAGYSLGIGDP
jgi:hypothetical protein